MKNLIDKIINGVFNFLIGVLILAYFGLAEANTIIYSPWFAGKVITYKNFEMDLRGLNK